MNKQKVNSQKDVKNVRRIAPSPKFYTPTSCRTTVKLIRFRGKDIRRTRESLDISITKLSYGTEFKKKLEIVLLEPK